MPRPKKIQHSQDSEQKLDLSYYKPINRQQREFHESSARHKLLIGGYGSGKTYPAIHEALLICYDNPEHQFLIGRNTWESLKENIEREFIEIAEEANCIKEYNRTEHDLILTCDTMIRFRPLSMTRSQYKGLNICGFLLDDPDVDRFKEVISFLYTRLRNSPKATANYFATIITANYEGHNWLWQQFMRGKEEGGDGDTAYWICPTQDNPTLPDTFIPDLAKIHSESWMQRFVYCNVNKSYTGLIYDEYDPVVHHADLSWIRSKDESDIERQRDLLKIMVIDIGVEDPTVVLHMATDRYYLYVYKEWYHVCRTPVLGEYLRREVNQDNYIAVIIDPAAGKRDPKTRQSTRDLLRKEYGVNTLHANNDILFGIEQCKTIMTVKDNKSHLFVDPKACPWWCREAEIYRWKEPEMSEFDELAYKETPLDKDNHCMDDFRYGTVFFHSRNFLRAVFNSEQEIADRRQALIDERMKKLRYYRENKMLATAEADMIIDLYENKRNGNMLRKTG